jgi:hypothetical protein
VILAISPLIVNGPLRLASGTSFLLSPVRREEETMLRSALSVKLIVLLAALAALAVLAGEFPWGPA